MALFKLQVLDPRLMRSLLNWCESRVDVMHPREVAIALDGLGCLSRPSTEPWGTTLLARDFTFWTASDSRPEGSVRGIPATGDKPQAAHTPESAGAPEAAFFNEVVPHVCRHMLEGGFYPKSVAQIVRALERLRLPSAHVPNVVAATEMALRRHDAYRGLTDTYSRFLYSAISRLVPPLKISDPQEVGVGA